MGKIEVHIGCDHLRRFGPRLVERIKRRAGHHELTQGQIDYICEGFAQELRLHSRFVEGRLVVDDEANLLAVADMLVDEALVQPQQ